MRALRLFGDRDARLAEMDEPPPPGPGEIQLRVLLGRGSTPTIELEQPEPDPGAHPLDLARLWWTFETALLVEPPQLDQRPHRDVERPVAQLAHLLGAGQHVHQLRADPDPLGRAGAVEPIELRALPIAGHQLVDQLQLGLDQGLESAAGTVLLLRLDHLDAVGGAHRRAGELDDLGAC